MMSMRIPSVFLLFVALTLAGCGEPPRTALTAEEKRADFEWLARQLEGNYAPLEMKQKKWRFDFAALKRKYLDEAEKTESNEAFYRLAHRFVAEMKDAHLQIVPPDPRLPGRAKIAYLGFDGIRQGDALLVTKILPTSGPEDKFPVKIGDRILTLNGTKLEDVARKTLAPYRNLGDDAATLTEIFPKLFHRSSLAHPMPTELFASLELERAGDKKRVRLPWIRKDVTQAARDEREAAKEKTASSPEAAFYGTIFDWLTRPRRVLPATLAALVAGRDYRFGSTFVRIDTAPTATNPLLRQFAYASAGIPASLWDRLKQERELPKDAVTINASGVFPAFVFSQSLPPKDGKAAEKLSIGYVYLPTFVLDGLVRPGTPPPPAGAFPKPLEEDDAVRDLATTLKALRTLKIDRVIVDLLDNGGGSIGLGLRLSQLFARARLTVPELRFRVSDRWLDTFEDQAQSGRTDAEKEIGRRLYEALSADRRKGKDLSEPHALDVLVPLDLQANDDLDRELDLALLVNESCASTCDLFAATMKDNRLATIVGTRSMGAGGNVRLVGTAPYGKFGLSVTESVALRRDGSFVENAGVSADVPVDTSAARKKKFAPVIRAAVDRWVK